MILDEVKKHILAGRKISGWEFERGLECDPLSLMVWNGETRARYVVSEAIRLVAFSRRVGGRPDIAGRLYNAASCIESGRLIGKRVMSKICKDVEKARKLVCS